MIGTSEMDLPKVIEASALEKMEADPELGEEEAYLLATVEQKSYNDAFVAAYEKAYREKKAELMCALISEGMDISEAGEEAKEGADEYAKEVAEEAAKEASDEAVKEVEKALFN